MPGRHSNLRDRMDPMRETAALAGQDRRVAGSDAERRAAVHVRDRLRSLGREAEAQAIQIRPRFGLTHAIHAVLAIVGSVVAVGSPPLGAALVLVAAVSAFLDVSGTLHVVRRLTGRRASQNVESLEDGDKSGVLVLVANYDAPRGSAAFERARSLLRDPWLAMLIAMLAILLCCTLRIFGIEGSVLTAVQFAPTVLLILLTPAFVDVELSEGVGAPADAAAVATVLGLAEELGGELEHFDVWVVLTGSQHPFALGMGGWLRRRRRELDRGTTAVLHVDSVGDGPVRFTRREGPLVPLRCHSELVRICEQIAEDDGEGGAYDAAGRTSRAPNDAAAAIARGFPALSVSCAGTEPDAAGLERALGFCRELVERLDAEVGPTLPAGSD